MALVQGRFYLRGGLARAQGLAPGGVSCLGDLPLKKVGKGKKQMKRKEKTVKKRQKWEKNEQK